MIGDRSSSSVERRALWRSALSIIAIGLIIVAGGRRATSAQDAGAGAQQDQAPPPPPPAGSTLAAIKERGVLRWGADAAGGAPFTFYDPADPSKIIGFEYDIMQRVAAKMGVQLEQVQADWLALYDMLKSGRCDMLMNGFEVTEERLRALIRPLEHAQAG